MIGKNSTHANFSVGDLKEAKAFYGDKLGFSIKRETPYEIMFESSVGTRFNVYAKEDHVAWDSTVFGIEVDDVRETVTELKSLDVLVENIEGTDENGIMTDPQMGSAAWFRDPAGNWICVSSTN